MKEVLIIGSGISGMTCAVRCAELGLHVTLVSPFPSERSQSVMAAGGINAVTDTPEEGDSVASHIEDTRHCAFFPLRLQRAQALRPPRRHLAKAVRSYAHGGAKRTGRPGFPEGGKPSGRPEEKANLSA